MAIIKKTNRIGEDTEKLELSCSPFGNLAIPQTLNIKLPHDPTIPLLGIYPREIKIYFHAKLVLIFN